MASTLYSVFPSYRVHVGHNPYRDRLLDRSGINYAEMYFQHRAHNSIESTDLESLRLQFYTITLLLEIVLAIAGTCHPVK